ncbi:MAG: ABC transporter substrate-binding protein [Alphaproteobacteria bacterium]|nr:ABC transporter substrate-binding protein [Alphaproteobacteria bacterium]
MTIAGAALAAGEMPRAVVESFSQGLIGVMKEAKALGFEGRSRRMAALVDETYDLPFMTRLAVGASWATMTQEQRDRLVAAFRRFTVATYASRFEGYSGERIVVAPDTTANRNGVVVETRLIQDDGDPVTLNYQLHETDARGRVVDVFLTGTISELATRRAEFAAVVRQRGLEGLIALLDERAVAMAAGR